MIVTHLFKSDSVCIWADNIENSLISDKLGSIINNIYVPYGFFLFGQITLTYLPSALETGHTLVMLK